MGYKTITDKTSKQYELQQMAYTDEEGFRKIDNRYCVAIGTAFGVYTGQMLDVELENGTVIECIVGDIKKEKDPQLEKACEILQKEVGKFAQISIQ